MDPSTLRLIDTPAGCRIPLRVRPAARRDAVLGPHGEALRVAVSAPPERGRANRAVLDLLARALRLPASSLSLVAGETSRDKIVLIAGMPASEVRRRLQGA